MINVRLHVLRQADVPSTVILPVVILPVISATGFSSISSRARPRRDAVAREGPPFRHAALRALLVAHAGAVASRGREHPLAALPVGAAGGGRDALGRARASLPERHFLPRGFLTRRAAAGVGSAVQKKFKIPPCQAPRSCDILSLVLGDKAKHKRA